MKIIIKYIFGCLRLLKKKKYTAKFNDNIKNF